MQFYSLAIFYLLVNAYIWWIMSHPSLRSIKLDIEKGPTKICLLESNNSRREREREGGVISQSHISSL